MEGLMGWLDSRMPTPPMYGWYHFLWLGIMIVECVLIYIFRKRISPKAVNIIMLSFGIALILFEVYKQVLYSYKGDGVWAYSWYAFPFQFCSTPMYIMTLAGILRKGKVYNSLTSYLATFALFGGLSVMFYPGDVFTTRIGINIHTMFWHSSMVVIAFLLLATRTVEFKFKTLLKGTYTFLVVLAMAMIMNIIWHYCGDPLQTFNMFYISPYYPCTLVIMNIIYDACPYIVFLLIYAVGFVLVAGFMLGCAILFDKLERRLQERRAKGKKVNVAQNSQPNKIEKQSGNLEEDGE